MAGICTLESSCEEAVRIAGLVEGLCMLSIPQTYFAQRIRSIKRCPCARHPRYNACLCASLSSVQLVKPHAKYKTVRPAPRIDRLSSFRLLSTARFRVRRTEIASLLPAPSTSTAGIRHYFLCGGEPLDSRDDLLNSSRSGVSSFLSSAEALSILACRGSLSSLGPSRCWPVVEEPH